MIDLTANEATIVGALAGAALGGIVAILTTNYLVKHGPNYQEQIGNLHKILSELAKTQDELKQQHADALSFQRERHIFEEKRAVAARWKPSARVISKVEGNQQVNT